MTRTISIPAVLMVSLATVVFALGQEPQMPTPGPEHKAVAAFAGKWSFAGKLEPGPMGPGGPVAFTENCEMFEGGFALVCRSEGKNPMGPIKTVSIMTYDSEKKAYTYYAVESGAPAFMAMGKSDGKTWNWKVESKMGGQTMDTAVTVVLTSPTSQTFDMKISMDGGKTWTPVMSGKSTKSAS
jgi:hypothetical protein